MDEELYQYYEYLLKYVPRSAELLLSQNAKDVEHIREQIILTHRAISLIPTLLNKTQYSNYLPDKTERPTFVFKPTLVVPPRVSPQLLQQASHLFQFIHSNPIALLDALLNEKDTPLFNYIIHSSLPSLFGYYSSQEHINFAFTFYAQVIMKCDITVGSEILIPFFRTTCIQKYIENTINPFAISLMSDSRISGSELNQSFLEFYKNYLKTLLFGASTCIMHYHSVIIKLMKDNWGVTATGEFLINTIIRYTASIWFSASGFSEKLPILNQVIDNFISDQHSLEGIVNKMIETDSGIEIPDMYHTFKHQYVLFLTTSHDFLALAKLMQKVIQIPQSVTTNNTETNPKNAVFWFKIFPKRKLPNHQIIRPLVFSIPEKEPLVNPKFDTLWREIQTHADQANIEPFEFLMSKRDIYNFPHDLLEYTLKKSIEALEHDATLFEQLMRFMVSISEMKKWFEVSQHCLDMVTDQVATTAATLSFKRGYQMINYAFQKASNLFDSNYIKQNQYIRLLQMYLPTFIVGVEKKLDILDSWWSSKIDQLNQQIDELESHFRGQAANNVLWDCVMRVSLVRPQNLLVSFRIILEICQRLSMLSKITGSYDIRIIGELFRKVAILGKAKGLMSVYIILGSIAFDSACFRDLCSEAEEHGWYALESALFYYVKEEPEIQAAMTEVQDHFRNIEKDGEQPKQ
ncbi:hypothetical protein TVAG_228460 [Trichomonas vaginalis G3]|uniref:Uncharacterized protein n=1 Tax=Trichomonas vaginalis (strain ATCC PRA-98 / G3) TaxID=412133 RepID=A2DJ08_TRIV3|nr:hypothetical protein TVAGG3_0483990 [Trichomonas vaginalis G3]EAY19583.1 hypothetical protein TVAG_228460 [Trichomonas vaginalis G3]KAI5515913.1 hypothetical protein TVAGG3_0483990 [Trichomonas vaginalis G3]|eukprot:XP_001580569.1 hypothetical protein [Trichomonas vaginalis G3]